MARRAGVSHPTASKALAALANVGIVSVRRTPGTDAFEFNEAHVLAPPIFSILQTEAELSERLVVFLREQISALTDKIDSAILFGSLAWGTPTAGSDIDLAVKCKSVDEEDVMNALHVVVDATRLRFGLRLNPLFTSPKRTQPPSLKRRIEREGVVVIGPGAQ